MPAEHNASNALIQALELGISYLQKLHVLSQTQSLMLDECDYEGILEVAESKGEIVNKIVALELGQLATKIPDEHSADLHALAQQANRLLTRISEVDGRNCARFERLRSEARELLQVSRNERSLRSTYDSLNV